MSVDDSLGRAEALLEDLKAKREELEQLTAADELDGDAAVDLVAQVAELAKEIEAELTRARAIADAGA